MLFDIENENGIIYNARDCSVTYNGRVWYEMPSAKSLPAGYEMIGRVGKYHFYAPADVYAKPWCMNADGYFVRGYMDV